MKTKYVCRGLISSYVNFHYNRTMWSTKLNVKRAGIFLLNQKKTTTTKKAKLFSPDCLIIIEFNAS